MSHTTIPRRTVLLGATAVGLGAAAGFRIPTGEARAPIVSGQVPYFYRFMVGKFQATVVSDGPLPLGEPSATLKGPTKEELAKALANNFLPTDNLVLEQNVLLLNTGSRLIMFDSGMGTSKAFGPTTGRLLSSLNEDLLTLESCTAAGGESLDGRSAGQRVRVVGLVHGVKSLAGPYVFCSVGTARPLLHLLPDQTTYLLARCRHPEDVPVVVQVGCVVSTEAFSPFLNPVILKVGAGAPGAVAGAWAYASGVTTPRRANAVRARTKVLLMTASSSCVV